MISWRRATLANARRNFAAPAGRRRADGDRRLHDRADLLLAGDRPPLLRRGLRDRRRSARSSGAASARAARPRASRRRVALVSMVRRNRRRYGGYIVHIGIAVLFIGVAASATFQHEEQLTLHQGQSVHVGAYTMRYVRATGAIVDDPDHTGATLTLGAVLRVTPRRPLRRRRCDPRPATTRRRRSSPGQAVASLINGDGVAIVALDSSLRRDLWAAINPPGRRAPGGARWWPRPTSWSRRRSPGTDRSRSPTTCSPRSSALRQPPAAAAVHAARVAAGHVDLDRRADRAARRR